MISLNADSALSYIFGGLSGAERLLRKQLEIKYGRMESDDVVFLQRVQCH